MFDTVIRGGTVVDGSGLPRYRADVGIADGRIAAIGRLDARGRQEIDAEGHIVTPGFIDGHTHMDAQINWDPLGSSSCWHGVTTAVMGNCGFTLAPSREGERALVLRNLERAEDISAAAMAEGIKWSWQSFPEHLDALERLPKGINYAAYIGHSAMRTWVMGERAFEEHASDDDLARMRELLLEGLRAGAVGFSTSRGPHETSDNRPVASRLADWNEVRELVCAMGSTGTGVFELSHEEIIRKGNAEERKEYLDRLRDLAVESRVPFSFGVTAGPAWREVLATLDDTAARGGRMYAQSHSWGTMSLMSFRTALPMDRVPEWREVRSQPLEVQARMLRDPAVRRRLVRAAHHGDYGHAVGAEAPRPDWAKFAAYEGPLAPARVLAPLAAERGVDPVELMIDMALESDFRQFYTQSHLVKEPEEIPGVLRHPWSVMTFSDAGAHVGQMLSASIQTYLLAYWVREQRAFSVEEAVRMMTQVPALVWGFHDRGMVREGLAADLNVIDPQGVRPLMPEVAEDLPAGAKRLIQKSEGIRATLVGGEVVLRDGRHTGALPGRLLRGALARRAA